MVYQKTIWKKGDMITSEKLNKIENAIEDINNGKNIIAEAITNKGVETSSDESFDQMAININSIETKEDIGLSDEEIKLAKHWQTATDWSYRFRKHTFTTGPEVNTSHVTSMANIFLDCPNLMSIPLYDTSNVTTMKETFSYCYELKTIPNLSTENVTDMEKMFSYCSSLQSLPLLNTQNVKNMRYTFSYCYNIREYLDFNTENVTNMEGLFYFNKSLEIAPKLNTSKVTNMKKMFAECRNLKQIHPMDTSKVEDFSEMFFWCENLTRIPLLNTSSARDMSAMFFGCVNVTEILFDPNSTNIEDFSLFGCNKLDKEGIVKMFESLPNMIHKETPVMITIPNYQYDLLTEEDKKIAIDKGYSFD